MPDQLAPRLYIKIDGQNVDETFMNALISVEVDSSLTLPDMFAIHLMVSPEARRGGRLQWIDDDQYALGESVEISSRAEDGSSEVKLMVGEITAIEPMFNQDTGPTLILRGYDKGHRLHRGRKTRTFQQMSDSDIVNQVASDAGLQFEGGSSATSQVHDYIIQNNKTDWEFLVSRAQRVGCFVTVREDTLHFSRSPNPGGQMATLEWADTLREFNARLTTAHQVSEVKVQGWDPSGQSQILGSAARPNDTPQIGESQHGGEIAEAAFGTAREIIVDRPVANQTEADALAQAICDEIGQGFVEADCECIGDPSIQAGAMVRLSGLGERFSGTYRVTHALHRRDATGYFTRFVVGGRHSSTIAQLLPNRGQAAANLGPSLGVVTNNSDPDDRGRVRVQITSLSDSAETFWARLVAPGAGVTTGMQWIPEVGDEVLVVFEHNDIHRPLVLGGLWSDRIPLPQPNSECVDDNGAVNERIIQSRSGHIIIFDDTDGSEKVTVKSRDGHEVILDDGGEKISITDKTGNNSMVIDSSNNNMDINVDGDFNVTAQGKVAITSTGDMTLEATGNGKFKAIQNMDVEATGNCTVKNAAAQIAMSGPTVNINNGALEVT